MAFRSSNNYQSLFNSNRLRLVNVPARPNGLRAGTPLALTRENINSVIGL
jgi:hypothetical protein